MFAASPTPVSASSPPAAFVVEQSPGGRGLRSELVLRSSGTGRIERTLGTFGQSFTNNGLAITQNLGLVFYTLAPARAHAGLRIMRLNTRNHRRSFVADGSEPALSPDDQQIAFGAVPEGISVRTLSGGDTRTRSLTRQLGASADLTQTSITWLADGRDVVLVAPPQFVADASGARAHPPAGSCHPQRRPILVFVHVPLPPAALSARCVVDPGLDLAAPVLGASPAAPDAVRVASSAGRNFTVRDVSPDGTVTNVLTATRGLAVAFDPAGDQLLYLRDHPPDLWSVRLAPAGGGHARELITNSQIGAAAW